MEQREFSRWEPISAAPLVKKMEGAGIKGHEFEAYKCPAGVWTIGYGHTGGVAPGTRIEPEEADKLLSNDLYRFHREITPLVTVQVTQGQYIAIMDFVYNLGVSAFKTSTLRKKLNLGDFVGASEEFPKWCFSGKTKLPGLVSRRKAEQRLFKGDAS